MFFFPVKISFLKFFFQFPSWKCHSRRMKIATNCFNCSNYTWQIGKWTKISKSKENILKKAINSGDALLLTMDIIIASFDSISEVDMVQTIFEENHPNPMMALGNQKGSTTQVSFLSIRRNPLTTPNSHWCTIFNNVRY